MSLAAGYRGGIGICGRPLLEAPNECLLWRRLPLLEDARECESLDVSFSAILKMREKNGFLMELEYVGDGDCVVEVAVYIDLSGGWLENKN
jgi:hypothetical protein